MSTRTYGQHCGLARSLDLLGERWTLLLLRDLFLGPKRYRDLLERLDGIGTNLLATRLRGLEEAGLVERVVAPGSATASAYALTDAADELLPAIEQLAVWGVRLVDPSTEGRFRPAWAALVMRAAMVRGGDAGVHGLVAFVVDDEPFWVRARGGDADVRDVAPPDEPDATLRTDVATFLALATGELTPGDAVRGGTLALAGDAGLVERLLAVFRLPGVGPGQGRGVARMQPSG